MPSAPDDAATRSPRREPYARENAKNEDPRGQEILCPAPFIMRSCRFAGRQTQPRQEQLAVLGVSEGHDARHDGGSNSLKACDGLLRFLQSSHMRIARREKPIG